MDKRMTCGGNGSHWDGCVDVHWDCRIAQLTADNARLTAELAELRERLAEIEATSPHQYNWEAHRFIKPPEADND